MHCFVKDKNHKSTTEMYSFEESHLTQYFKDDTVFVDMISTANSIYENLKTIVIENSSISMKMKAKILTAKLSALTSFLLLKIMAEISPIDHVEKHRLKIQYIEEDVKMFESLLNVYYVHGVVTGCILENTSIEKSTEVTVERLNENKERLNKVHPYCSIIAELKEKTAKAVLKYASGNTFRPKEPSYGSFAKVTKHTVYFF